MGTFPDYCPRIIRRCPFVIWLGLTNFCDIMSFELFENIIVRQINMEISRYSYLKSGFEGVLYRSDRTDDRLIIVIQGLKGLELPQKYAELFCGYGYSALAMSYYGCEGQKQDIRAIPLEQFQTACDEMIRLGFGRI